MELSEIYAVGKQFFGDKDYGGLLDYAETGFICTNDRRVINAYTFRQRCVGARPSRTDVEVSGVALQTPVIMSAMTMPIPSIRDDALFELARGLKAVGSLMWTGTPIPGNLDRIAVMGVPLAAGGEAAVTDLVRHLTRELQRLMTMVGCPDPAAVRRDTLIATTP